METDRMAMQYESYKTYNPLVSTIIEPRARIITALSDSEDMLRYLECNVERFEEILGALEEQISGKIGNYRSLLVNFSFPEIQKEHLKTDYPVYEFIIHLVSHVLGLPENYDFNAGETYEVAKVSSIGAIMVPRFYRIKALLDVFGRDTGISTYKKYIQEMANEPMEKQNEETVEELRLEMAEEWSRHEAMDYSIYSFDSDMFVARFDKCLNFDALKDLGDREVGFLASCYHGPFMMQRSQKYLRMRRTVTLFDHHYCDELYWNCSVHPEPEQPALEFTDKLVLK